MVCSHFQGSEAEVPGEKPHPHRPHESYPPRGCTTHNISGWQFSTMNQKSYWHDQSKALKGFTHDLSTSRDCTEGEKQVSAQECWLLLFYLI